MFDIGFWELVVLFGIGLLVLGPERLPRVAAQLGRWVGRARSMARHLSNQVRDEMEPFEQGVRSVDQTLRRDFSARRPEPGQTAPGSEPDSGTVARDASASDDTGPPAGREP